MFMVNLPRARKYKLVAHASGVSSQRARCWYFVFHLRMLMGDTNSILVIQRQSWDVASPLSPAHLLWEAACVKGHSGHLSRSSGDQREPGLLGGSRQAPLKVGGNVCPLSVLMGFIPDSSDMCPRDPEKASQDHRISDFKAQGLVPAKCSWLCPARQGGRQRPRARAGWPQVTQRT